jgi:hypothetical protein
VYTAGGAPSRCAAGACYRRVKKHVFRQLLGEAWRNVALKRLIAATPKEPAGRSGER